MMWLVAPARAQIPQLFQTLDQNADGVLSRSELGVFSQSAIGPNGQPLDVAGQQTHFDTLDLNSDGKISYEEALKNADSKNNLRLRIQLSEDRDDDDEDLDSDGEPGGLSLVGKDDDSPGLM